MLLFRSEEHARRWPGFDAAGSAMVSLPVAWVMAEAWFGERLARDWRRTPQRAREIFARFGLTGPFWELPGF